MRKPRRAIIGKTFKRNLRNPGDYVFGINPNRHLSITGFGSPSRKYYRSQESFLIPYYYLRRYYAEV